MSDSVRPHRQQPTRLPCPWDSPGKNTGVGCHFLLQCMKWKVKVKLLSRVWPSATPWTTVFQAPLSMGFSRQEYWSGLPLPSPRCVRRRHLLDFFFITKIGEFRGEQDSSICFNSSCVTISSLAVYNFSFVRGHCSVQIGSSFFQVILIIVLFVKWAVAPRNNVECISEFAIA